MKKYILALFLLGMVILANTSYAIALNNTSVQIGTDRGTSSFPMSGMNTTPTKMIGTDAHVVNPDAPFTKPEYAPGGVWPLAPSYTPQAPATSSVTH
ncbi:MULTISPECIES: hypothetical protein [Legionella]|uniref:Uncharacterized protein n=1 Tax=Legionella drozanskii LLAP-1 TaxID=1212489 RepID=A0A0W0SWL6_9GAMM|nr:MULTISPECIES: hypothetical protein [Legionella]KTC87754.1 hypothetical protein Ldro_1373 [Legionella drozanskii LLAP-1]PJE10997.1 MAG: hypothetical protein CK430_09380 [Legionella sp.]